MYVFITDGEIHVDHVNERRLQKLLTELANFLDSVSLENAYSSRYKIVDNELEVVGDDDTNHADIVPLLSGTVYFWCESVSNIRQNVEDIFLGEDGITCKIWAWLE